MKLPFVFVIWLVCCHFSAFSQQDVSDALKTGANDEISIPLLPVYEINLFEKTDPLRGSSRIIVEKKNKNTGVYWGLSDSGDTLFTIGYRRNKLHGTWKSWGANKQLIDSGRLQKNVPDGEWKSWYTNGQLRTVRTYSADKLTMAQHAVKHYNPKTNMNALATMEKKHPGSYKKYTHPAYSFMFLPAHFHQRLSALSLVERSTQNRSTKDVYIPPFNQCLHDGQYINYFANGQVKDSGVYNNGFRNGIWVELLQDGNIISKGAYLNDKKIHSWSFYDRNRKLLALKYYNRQGTEINSKKYN